jgi:hypothetical protein
MKNEDKTAEAFSGELWKATMIKNILEDNNIQAFLNNELLGSVAPYLADGGGMANIKVIVNAAQLDDALKLIDEFNSSEAIEE